MTGGCEDPSNVLLLVVSGSASTWESIFHLLAAAAALSYSASTSASVSKALWTRLEVDA